MIHARVEQYGSQQHSKAQTPLEAHISQSKSGNTEEEWMTKTDGKQQARENGKWEGSGEMDSKTSQN